VGLGGRVWVTKHFNNSCGEVWEEALVWTILPGKASFAQEKVGRGERGGED